MSADSPLPDEAAAFLRGCLGEEWTAQPLAGDASVRSYYRIARPDGTTYMLAYYPQDVRGQLVRFLSAYRTAASPGRFPEVLHHSELAVLQRDVGDRSLYDALHQDRAEGVRWYHRAIELLVAFQDAADDGTNPPFTAELFTSELDMAREFFVERLMGVAPERAALLNPLFKTLSQKIICHPYVLCHRDYHGQNIHVFNNSLYVIDYQDLRMGPDTYDIASLLRDRGVAGILGDDAELELVDRYGALMEERRSSRCSSGRGVSPDAHSAPLRRRYFESLLQRSIKVLGTFAKQPIVRRRLHYLDFIPPALESVRRCLVELPEMAALEELLPMRFVLEETRERLRKEQNGSSNHVAAR
jgi:aminoglycoside/choline kinase family phosphotransferase